jgi:hypothetical protein
MSLDEILKAINLHEATEDNKQLATVIIKEIFKENEKIKEEIHNRSEN